jgi:hypothetical protein
MNLGFGHSPQRNPHEGVKMPTTLEKPAWTHQDEVTANELIGRVKRLDPKMGNPWAKAAFAMGFHGGYKDQALTGVRTYIKSLKTSDPGHEIDGNHVITHHGSAGVKLDFNAMEKAYYKEMDDNPDLQIARTHPDHVPLNGIGKPYSLPKLDGEK